MDQSTWNSSVLTVLCLQLTVLIFASEVIPPLKHVNISETLSQHKTGQKNNKIVDLFEINNL